MLLAIATVGCDRENSSIVKRSTLQFDETKVKATAPDSPSDSSESKSATTRTINLRIEVSGFDNGQGSCRVAVYHRPAHFNDAEFAIAKQSLSIQDLKATWHMELAIPEATETDSEDTFRLSISAYHDENANSRLDKNSFGIPTERYGFSRNPKRGFGPPKFAETAMELGLSPSGDSNTILDVPIQIK